MTAMLQFGVLAQEMTGMTDFSTSSQGHHMSTGPSGPLDFIVSVLAVIIVLLVIVMTIKYFLKPKEKSPDHIKRRILQDNF